MIYRGGNKATEIDIFARALCLRPFRHQGIVFVGNGRGFSPFSLEQKTEFI